MTVKLEHVGIYVENMDQSIRFYTNVFGMILVERVWLFSTPKSLSRGH